MKNNINIVQVLNNSCISSRHTMFYEKIQKDITHAHLGHLTCDAGQHRSSIYPYGRVCMRSKGTRSKYHQDCRYAIKMLVLSHMSSLSCASATQPRTKEMLCTMDSIPALDDGGSVFNTLSSATT